MYSSALFETAIEPAVPAQLCPCSDNPALKVSMRVCSYFHVYVRLHACVHVRVCTSSICEIAFSLQYEKILLQLVRHSPARGLTFLDTLESAQLRKIDALLARLEPLGPEHTLLDIGFGWGGICIRAAEKYGCQVHGITLSTEQKALAEERVAAKGVGHLMNFELVDYREFSRRRVANNDRKFDRIVSCEMIEAVGHNHLESFFATVESLLHTEGIFVMQVSECMCLWDCLDGRVSTYC